MREKRRRRRGGIEGGCWSEKSHNYKSSDKISS